jgi:hypothetical protein
VATIVLEIESSQATCVLPSIVTILFVPVYRVALVEPCSERSLDWAISIVSSGGLATSAGRQLGMNKNPSTMTMAPVRATADWQERSPIIGRISRRSDEPAEPNCDLDDYLAYYAHLSTIDILRQGGRD